MSDIFVGFEFDKAVVVIYLISYDDRCYFGFHRRLSSYSL